MLPVFAFRCCNRLSRLSFVNLTQVRPSTSNIINQHDHFRIEDVEAARTLCKNLSLKERDMLELAIKETKCEKGTGGSSSAALVDRKELKQLFVFNLMPFIGFGILDNMLMILAGEYIEHSIGAVFTISTMAAAALGNTVSDVAGMGLAHYVEQFVVKMGIKQPALTAVQIESSRVRITVNAARTCGLIIGCTLGMFPLLFF